jgi:peptidoglycan/xylan/chitin deacetylase (PgdA/CDA1 family)
LGVREAVPAILSLFEQFGIHATWATVGFLFFENKKELLQALPAVLPQYVDTNLSPYPHLAEIGEDEASDPFHFAPSLIRRIRHSPGQEIASHTFSHYYCLEPGQNITAFAADLRAAQAAAAPMGMSLRSLVLPRNQIDASYLEAARIEEFHCYRGNASGWYQYGVPIARDGNLRRALRLADAYLPLRKPAFRVGECGGPTPLNVPASRFLRPWSRSSRHADFLLLQRIRRELTAAANRRTVYHLWWHPHNFGAEVRENIARLRNLLEHFAQLRRTRGMQSLNMAEIADLAAAGRPTASAFTEA